MTCKCNDWSVKPSVNEDGTTTHDFVTVRNCKCGKNQAVGSSIMELTKTEIVSFREFCMDLDRYASPELSHKLATFQAINMKVEYSKYIDQRMKELRGLTSSEE